MTPDSSDRTTAVPPTGQSTPPGPRLRLDPTLARGGIGGILDGGWWPRSRDPGAELPDLIAGLESSLGVVTRMAVNLDAWDSAPRRVVVDGRRVHVGWFRAMDGHTIGVTRGSRERFVLLVVTPEATAMAAATAMAMAVDATNSIRPADILAASGIGAEDAAPILAPMRPQGRATPPRDDEAGRPTAPQKSGNPSGAPTSQQCAPTVG